MDHRAHVANANTCRAMHEAILNNETQLIVFSRAVQENASLKKNDMFDILVLFIF